MSTDVIYPMLTQPHPKGLFAGIELPKADNILISVSGGRHNMVPIRVTRDGNLHYAVFSAPQTMPVTDLVFRVQGSPHERCEGEGKIAKFAMAIRAIADSTGHHTAIRHMKQAEGVPYLFVVLRFYFNRDFECKEHPEFQLGEPTRPYRCPFCNAMLISGMPHIEADHD